jgi:acyl-CoA reductase-like NAD-dependent aldehyde dehydrogenase
MFVSMRRNLASQAGPVLRQHYGLWIDGKETQAEAGAGIEVHNPATRGVLATVAEAREADVRRAVAAASAAFEDGRWSEMETRSRGRILARFAGLLRDRIGAMAILETLQTGRCIREYRAQLARIPEWFEYHAALAQSVEGQLPQFSDKDHMAFVRRVPLGVCGLVTSWNHPLLIACKKISVALASGNTVVVKPSEFAPITVLEVAALLEEAGVPSGVVNVINGFGGVAGHVLTEHPDVAKIDFTGGTSTGYRIGEAAGRFAKRYCAELGGNAPIMVFDDCQSVDTAVNGVAFAAFVASGQTCVSAKRILIQETIFDEFVQKLVSKVSQLRLADPMDMNTQMGPLVSATQLATVERQVDAALAEGAEVLTGGRRPGPDRCPLTNGHFYEPTVLKPKDAANSAFQEEIFGPVITVMPFRDEQEAVSLANNSKYGLGGGVWTLNVARAHRVARKTKAGVFWINAHHRNDPSCPWGGFKESGIGRENGLEAFHEYTETQSVVLRTAEEPEDWFGNLDARYN